MLFNLTFAIRVRRTTNGKYAGHQTVMKALQKTIALCRWQQRIRNKRIACFEHQAYQTIVCSPLAQQKEVYHISLVEKGED